MTGYVLQILKNRDWRWTNQIYWTRAEAVRAGKRLFRRHPPGAREVRIHQITVDVNSVVALPERAGGADLAGEVAS